MSTMRIGSRSERRDMIANIRQIYREYLRAIRGTENAATGRMEVMLEVEQRVRLLREIEGTSLYAMSKIEILSTLETLLNSLGEREQVERTYDHLEEWRRLRIEASQTVVESASPSAEPLDSLLLDQGSPTLQLLGQTSPTLVDHSDERTLEIERGPHEEGR